MFFKTVTSFDEVVSTATDQMSTQLRSWRWFWSSPLNLDKIYTNFLQHTYAFLFIHGHTATTFSQHIPWLMDRKRPLEPDNRSQTDPDSSVTWPCFMKCSLCCSLTGTSQSCVSLSLGPLGTEVTNNVNFSTITTQQPLLLFVSSHSHITCGKPPMTIFRSHCHFTYSTRVWRK